MMNSLSQIGHHAAAFFFMLVIAGRFSAPSVMAAAPDAPKAGPLELIKLTLQSKKLFQEGNYREAIPPTKAVLEASEATFGVESPRNVTWLNNLGMLYSATGDFVQAAKYLSRGLRIEKRQNPKGLATADLLDNLGILSKKLGQLHKARDEFEQALAIYKLRQPDSLRVAEILHNLGMVVFTQGDFALGRRYQDESLARYQATGGAATRRTAIMLSNLGNTLREMGEFDAARPCFEKALAIQMSLPANHSDRGAVLHNYATLLAQMKRYDEAQTHFTRAIEIYEASLGNHVQTAAAHGGLGLLCFRMRDYPAARKSYDRALEIFSRLGGKNDLDAAVVLVNLGRLYVDQNQDEDARPYLEKGLKTFSDTLGENHFKTARARMTLAALEAKQGQWKAAAEYADKSRRAVRSASMRLLPVLAEREQLAYLSEFDMTDWHTALAIGLARSADAQLAGLSATWLINGKAVVEDVSARRVLAARNATDSQASDLLQELLNTQLQIAALSQMTPAAENQPEHRAQIAHLVEEERSLTRHLGETGVVPNDTGSWVSIEEVRASLPDKAVMVNLIQLLVPRLSDAAEKAAPRYVAWVVPRLGDGDVRIVDLGPSDVMDQAVARVRLDIDGDTDTGGLAELSRLVYAPLEPYLESANRWVICPDGSLWLVPWQVLLTKSGRYAIEDHRISYVMSGRELVEGNRVRASDKQGIVMANPRYSAILAATEIARGQTGPNDQWRALSGKLPKEWPELVGTKIEIERALPQITKYLGKKPMVYMEDAATEAAFKRSRQPRAVVLSTHGVFLPERAKPRTIADANGDLAAQSLKFDDPLQRTGLVMAGANHHAAANGDDSDTTRDDGILTGLEIVGTDLRGTELVVLSACNTGLGELRAGEGAASLRHAFRLAGADAVLASLWKVSDTKTAALMEAFWTNVAAGDSKVEAIHKAQLSILYNRDKAKELAAETSPKGASVKKRGEGASIPFDSRKVKPPKGNLARSRDVISSPIFWAAFTLTDRVEDKFKSE